jgi:hypothetical protein
MQSHDEHGAGREVIDVGTIRGILPGQGKIRIDRQIHGGLAQKKQFIL